MQGFCWCHVATITYTLSSVTEYYDSPEVQTNRTNWESQLQMKHNDKWGIKTTNHEAKMNTGKHNSKS